MNRKVAKLLIRPPPCRTDRARIHAKELWAEWRQKSDKKGITFPPCSGDCRVRRQPRAGDGISEGRAAIARRCRQRRRGPRGSAHGSEAYVGLVGGGGRGGGGQPRVALPCALAKGNPTLRTLLAVLKTVGLRLPDEPEHVSAYEDIHRVPALHHPPVPARVIGSHWPLCQTPDGRDLPRLNGAASSPR